MRVQYLASLSGLRIQHCCKLWHRPQMRLRPGVAVAVVWTSSCISNLPPSLETSTSHRCGHKKKERKKKKDFSVFGSCMEMLTKPFLKAPNILYSYKIPSSPTLFWMYFKRFKKKMLNDLQKRLQETWTVEKAQISNWVLLEGLKLLKVGASILSTF